jgi:hypothetical protein
MTTQQVDRPELVFSKTIWNSLGGLDAILAFAVPYAMLRLTAALRPPFRPNWQRFSQPLIGTDMGRYERRPYGVPYETLRRQAAQCNPVRQCNSADIGGLTGAVVLFSEGLFDGSQVCLEFCRQGGYGLAVDVIW